MNTLEFLNLLVEQLRRIDGRVSPWGSYTFNYDLHGEAYPRLHFFDEINSFPLVSATIVDERIIHAEGGGALGISIFYLTQSYTIQHGGISKCIRNNCTSLILFKTKNEREFKQIQEECSGEVEPETFKQMYDYAVDKPHSFLFVDLHPKENHPSQFRCCFDEFLGICEN